MEAVLAHEMHSRQVQLRRAGGAARSIKRGRFDSERVNFNHLLCRVCAIGVDQATVAGDFGSFALDRLAEIFADHAHCCDAVGAECLHNLQWCHQAVYVDLS
jgi:hypothetical protein